MNSQSPTLGRNGRTAVRALEIVARLVDAAKRPDFRFEDWDELAALHDVARFRRIAANRETRDWTEDLRLRHQFAMVADFTYEVRRVAEAGNRVYIDTIETIITADDRFSVNTLGVVDFDDDGRIVRNKTYQQWDPHRVPGHVGRAADRAGLTGATASGEG